MINWCFSLHHSCEVLSPSKTGYIISAHRLTNIILLPLIQATLNSQGESPSNVLINNEDKRPVKGSAIPLFDDFSLGASDSRPRAFRIVRRFVRKKKSPRICTSMHSEGFEPTNLTYSRLEENNLITSYATRATVI